jgi:periplasmic protein TonB
MHALGYFAGIVGSFLLHVLLAFAVLGFPGQRRDAPSLPIEFEVREPPKPPAPPPPEPEPPKNTPAPEAARRVVKEAKAAPQPARAAPVAAAPVTAAPIFGVDMTQASAEGTVAVPIGETTLANPKAKRPEKAAPSPVAPPPPPPVKEVTIKELPEVIAQPLTDGYPPECRDAERQGVEGTVRLSVMVLESGKVGEVRLQKGIDPCLDAAALRLARQVKFKPAMASDGRPAPYRIKDYRFKFEIKR